ncbi:hypothetical protein MKP09_06120 [Niabella ginsengisoli]|uniref:Arylsulfatase n=2 Tax=Niabella ginsengisoli TaxID=522298 RepID=A0ABS9SGL0_9BACT|nr:hypothetical protein [Niabella ginsengisoli]
MYAAITNPKFTAAVRNDIVMHSIDGSFSIRKGNWKLEFCPGSGGWSPPKSNEKNPNLPVIQLYDLANDIEEKNNVEAQHPDIVKELTTLMTKYIKEGRSTPGKPQQNDGDFITERMFFLSDK